MPFIKVHDNHSANTWVSLDHIAHIAENNDGKSLTLTTADGGRFWFYSGRTGITAMEYFKAHLPAALKPTGDDTTAKFAFLTL